MNRTPRSGLHPGRLQPVPFPLARRRLAASATAALIFLAGCFGTPPAGARQPLEPPPPWLDSPIARVLASAPGEPARGAMESPLTAGAGPAAAGPAAAGPRAAEAVPGAADEEAKGCVAGPGESVYHDPAGAFCFAFPSTMAINGSSARTVSVVGPPLVSTPEAIFVSLGVDAQPAPRGDLEAGVDAALAQFADFAAWEITRSPTSLDEVPAIRVEPVPGRMSSRDLFVQQAELLYRLSFWPAQLPAVAPELEALYSTVISSFRFLEPEQAAAAPLPDAIVRGTVRHGDDAVSGARVTLRMPDWRTNPAAIVMETLSTADGAYALVGAPAGRYEVVAEWPDGQGSGAPPTAGLPVEIGDGVTVVTADPALALPLALTAPTAEEPAAALPTLVWEAIEGAVRYRVVLMDRSGGDSPWAGDVDAPTLRLEAPLQPGHRYEVIINALTAQGGLLASGGGSFTVAP